MNQSSPGNFEVVEDDVQADPPLPSEDSILAFVHNKRVQMVKEMLQPDGKMPLDTKDKSVMLAALKDMDGSALARKRLVVDANNGDITAGAAAAIAKLLTVLPNNGKRDLPIVPGRQIPKLGADIPPPELLDGETATTLPQQSYDTFMSKFPHPGDTR